MLTRVKGINYEHPDWKSALSDAGGGNGSNQEKKGS